VIKYVISVAIVVIGVAAFIGLKSLAKPPATKESKNLIQRVNTANVQAYSGVLDMEVSGTVVPFREIKIATEVGGRIKTKYAACESGTFVSKGEKLIEIDPEEYELEIETLAAEVTQSEKRIDENKRQIEGEESNIELAKQDFALQQKEFDRNIRLTGVLSQTELDQAQRALNAVQTQLTNRESNLATLIAGTARLEAALELSKRRLEMADLNLRRTTIVAPDDGVIVREMVQEGDYVAKGTQIATFEDTSQAEVLCNLTTADLEWIQANAPPTNDLVEGNDRRLVYRLPKTNVSIYDPNEPKVIWQGVLERFDGIGRDELTKTIPCRITVAQPIAKTESGSLRALVRGMYVKCRVEVQTSTDTNNQNLVTFPADGIQPDGVAWLVEDGRIHRVHVEIVDRNEKPIAGKLTEMVVVRSGPDTLSVDDQVVQGPLPQPSEGAPVELIEPTSSSKITPVLDQTESSAGAQADAAEPSEPIRRQRDPTS
jgi:multidrug efflux pump subunit AcrA (membrane-fusion protein)